MRRIVGQRTRRRMARKVGTNFRENKRPRRPQKHKRKWGWRNVTNAPRPLREMTALSLHEKEKSFERIHKSRATPVQLEVGTILTRAFFSETVHPVRTNDDCASWLVYTAKKKKKKAQSMDCLFLFTSIFHSCLVENREDILVERPTHTHTHTQHWLLLIAFLCSASPSTL